MVLGIPDFWIWSAFLLCIASALLCIVYGLINWNRGGDNVIEQTEVKPAGEEEKKSEA